MRKIISIAIGEDYHLLLTFQDGIRVSFDVRPYINGEWYSALRNPEYFRQVKVHSVLEDTIEWPDGQDIGPEDIQQFGKIVAA